MDLTDPETKAEAIAALESFRQLLIEYDATYDRSEMSLYTEGDGGEAKRAELRPKINHRMRGVRHVLEATSTLRTFHSPRFRNLDPLMNLFNDIEDVSMTRAVLDAIEESLGVLATPVRLLELAKPRATSAVDRVLRLCRRFPLVARQLQHRHAQRQTLIIADEHDAQDLMHALLRVDFDDVRPESWTPEYAGRASRVDFLLKNEQIVLEQKHAHDGKRDVGGELIIDIKRYAEHPHCQTLICFVYDPDHRLLNPTGLERDLTRCHEKLDVVCIIAPT